MISVDWIQKWYNEYCDNYWEHSDRVHIETVDNPGWSVDIDLTDTCLEEETFEKYSHIIKEDDWIICEKRKNHFTASGDIFKLETLLMNFYNWAGKKETSLFLTDNGDPSNLQLIINFDSMEKIETNGNLTGEIYFKLGDSYFPRRNYEDYIMPLILNWLKAINKPEEQIVLSFYNYSGAIRVKQYCQHPQLIFVGNREKYYKNVPIEVDVLEKIIRKQAEKLIQIADGKQWALKSFKELKLFLDK